MIQVNRICLIFNLVHFLVDSSENYTKSILALRETRVSNGTKLHPDLENTKSTRNGKHECAPAESHIYMQAASNVS